MKWLVISILFMVGCSTTKSATTEYEGHVWDHLNPTSETKSIENFYISGALKSKGKIVHDEEGENTFLKVGEWIEYYEDGELKSIGTYAVGDYIQCCTAGPCREYYNYKVGQWEYRYPSGRMKAKGIYDIADWHIKTSCEGGDLMKFGRINAEWEIYYTSGEKVDSLERYRKELEVVRTEDKYNFTDLYIVGSKVKVDIVPKELKINN